MLFSQRSSIEVYSVIDDEVIRGSKRVRYLRVFLRRNYLQRDRVGKDITTDMAKSAAGFAVDIAARRNI